jgi:hypothetical protein
MINAVVVNARCKRNRQAFGIRMEEKSPRYWVADWAFAVKDAVAKKEGYSQNISGRFDFADEYPGCPHCGGKTLMVCSCGKVSCWDGISTRVTCPWCLREVEISGVADQIGVQQQY